MNHNTPGHSEASQSTIQFSAVKLPEAPVCADTNESAAKSLIKNLQRGQNELPPSIDENLPIRVIINAIGQMLYRVGLQTEYLFIQGLRICKRIGRVLSRGLKALFSFAIGPLAALFLSIGRDLAAPFYQFFVGIRNALRAAHEEAEAGGSGKRAGFEYLKGGLRSYGHLTLDALRYLLPAGALCLFVFTAQSILGSSFSLGVNYNGDFLVFIENESVWDTAEKMVQERVVASEGAKVEWEQHPVFELQLVDPAARTNVSELADKIITASSNQIMRAVGIRINGELIGMVEDGQAIQNMLTAHLAQYDDGTHESVDFLYPIEQIPGVYFTNSVSDTQAVMNTLQSGDLLSVKTMDTIEYEETVEYTTETVESDQYDKGVRFVSQRGSNGSQHVVARETRVNGQVFSVEPVEVTVIKEMVPRIVTVGTRKPTYTVGSVVGNGTMIFPVPQLSYITTRFGQGRPAHRGIDLCAPAGTPVLAVDNGVVIEAGSHASWGNYVLIDHGNGYTTRYAHCTALMVAPGSAVSAGQQIGTVGRTGFASGNHVHFELTSGGRLIDPAPYLGVG